LKIFLSGNDNIHNEAHYVASKFFLNAEIVCSVKKISIPPPHPHSRRFVTLTTML